jgi:uncharacterized FlaG/YvyC family protein
MQIESRIPDISQQSVQNAAGDVASRQRSGTSGPSGKVSGESAREKPVIIPGNKSNDAPPRMEAIDLQVTLEKLNELVKDQQRDVAFSVDKRANTTVIKFFKTKTGELIKQFPPEEILAMKAKLRENTGWLVDKKA